MTYDLVIQNGTIVTSTAVYQADVAIQGEKIAAIGQRLSGKRLIDASGKYVIPGGVDIHVHMQMPLGNGITSSDTFFTGTRAAALGGTTAIVDFVAPDPDESMLNALAKRRAEADGEVVIDYGLHMTISPYELDKLDEMQAVKDAGISTVKLYMAYGFFLDDAQLYLALKVAKKYNLLPVIHAENWQMILTLIAENLAQGNTASRWHPRSRPAVMEGEAVQRVISMAEYIGTPAHIFHVSCDEAVQQITDARRRGLPITGETCPQYLFNDWSVFEEDGIEALLPVCAPPIREPEQGKALWQALKRGDLQIVTTDHCPFVKADKARGEGDFSKIPGGVPSIEMRLAGIYNGVRGGQFTLSQWVDMCCTRPAQLAGFTHKGDIVVGYDADIVLFDPDKTITLSTETLHENVDWTLYDGLTLTGWTDTTIRRGEVIVRNGEFIGAKGSGRYVERALDRRI